MTVYDDEKILLERVAREDREAFKILYSRHLDNFYRYVSVFTTSNETAEEIVQTVFMKIWERRETLPDIISFQSYIYRCAKNLLLDQVRRKKMIARVLDELRPSTAASDRKADDKVVYEEYFRITQQAIDLLPQRRKQIVELRTHYRFTFDEIAKQLSISKSVVKKQLCAGMLFVRAYLKKHGELDI